MVSGIRALGTDSTMTALLYRERSADVSRAIGVVAAQSDCTGEEAFAMLEARAVIFDQSVEQIAEAVLERKMRFRYGAKVSAPSREIRLFN